MSAGPREGGRLGLAEAWNYLPFSILHAGLSLSYHSPCSPPATQHSMSSRLWSLVQHLHPPCCPQSPKAPRPCPVVQPFSLSLFIKATGLATAGKSHRTVPNIAAPGHTPMSHRTFVYRFCEVLTGQVGLATFFMTKLMFTI